MYKYVSNYTEGYSSYNTGKVAGALETIRATKPDPEYDEKKVVEYHCSLCGVRFKSQARHFGSYIHEKNQARFVRRYYTSLVEVKRKLQGGKGYFGINKGIKKMRLFSHLYSFE